MRETMQRQCVKARVTGQHFPCAAGGRIPLKYAGDVFAKATKYQHFLKL
jgi:hypothetical protein